MHTLLLLLYIRYTTRQFLLIKFLVNVEPFDPKNYLILKA